METASAMTSRSEEHRAHRAEKVSLLRIARWFAIDRQRAMGMGDAQGRGSVNAMRHTRARVARCVQRVAQVTNAMRCVR